MSRNKPISLKEAYDLGYFDSEHGFPDGTDYDINIPDWDSKFGDAYVAGFQQRDKERRTNTMKNNPSAKDADKAYKAGHKAGLHNTDHKKTEYDLSPYHYELGYDDGRSDRIDGLHLKENPVRRRQSINRGVNIKKAEEWSNSIPDKDLNKTIVAYEKTLDNATPLKTSVMVLLRSRYKKLLNSKMNPSVIEKNLTRKKNSTVRINPDDIKDKPMKNPFPYKDYDMTGMTSYTNPKSAREGEPDLSRKVLGRRPNFVKIGDAKTKRAYFIGYIYGVSHEKLYDFEERDWDLNAYNAGRSDGIVDRLAKENPNNPIPRKNSTVRINPSKEYFHDEDPIWVRDQGIHDAVSERPYRGEKYGKLRGEYDNGYNHGLRMEKRKNPHLQFEENPKLSKLLTAAEADAMSDDEIKIRQYERGYRAGSLNHPSHERLAGMFASSYRKGYDEGRDDRVNNTVRNPKQKSVRRYFPKVKPGRPAGGPKGGYWWILDIYDFKDRKLGHIYGKGTKEKATLDAKYKVGDKYQGKTINRAMLSGPYSNKPTSKTRRK